MPREVAQGVMQAFVFEEAKTGHLLTVRESADRRRIVLLTHATDGKVGIALTRAQWDALCEARYTLKVVDAPQPEAGAAEQAEDGNRTHPRV